MIGILGTGFVEFLDIIYIVFLHVELLIVHVVFICAFFDLIGILLVDMAVDFDVHSLRTVDHHFHEKIVNFSGSDTFKFFNNLSPLVEGEDLFHQHLRICLVFLSKILVFFLEVVNLG